MKSSSGGSSDHSANTPPGVQVAAQRAQPLGGVERRVAGVQHVPRGVVDVEQHGVHALAGRRRRTRAAPRASAKKSPCTSRARGSSVSVAASGSRRSLVPADHRGERLDDHQRAHPRLLERGDRGVAEPQPADDDVELVAGAGGQPQPGQLDLGDREQARHEELLAELDLVDVDLERALEPATQADLAHRRCAASPAPRSACSSADLSLAQPGPRRLPLALTVGPQPPAHERHVTTGTATPPIAGRAVEDDPMAEDPAAAPPRRTPSGPGPPSPP